MRVLWYSIKAPSPPGPEAMGHPELDVEGLHARRVDCGDFGYSEPKQADYDCPVHLLPVFPVRPYPYSIYVRGLAAALREVRPDVMYIVGEPSELGVAQVVRTARRTVPACRTVLQSFENVHRDWSGFPKILRGRAERATLPRLDMVRAVSEGARRILVERGYPEDRIRVLPLTADGDLFYPREAPPLRARLAPQDRLLVGYVGRLVDEKGVDVLLRAISEMAEDAVLCAIGTGRLADELHALAEELGVEVHWLDRIPHDEIADYMRAFDVMVLPSRSIPAWQEQFGMVLAEAMACGTPVVGSSCGAIPEVIGDAGFIFPEEDHRALAEALTQIARDETLRAELAERAVARTHEHFDPERTLQRLVDCFHEALEAPPLETE